MSDLATKMSLSATSDKAKHQGPSSCHVLTGAWGKTPSGAGKYFPNRHPRKHRFHLMIKSAVTTAICILLAFVCQIATATGDHRRIQGQKEITALEADTMDYKKYVPLFADYIKKNDLQGVHEINTALIREIFPKDSLLIKTQLENNAALREKVKALIEDRKAMKEYEEERNAHVAREDKEWSRFDDMLRAHFEEKEAARIAQARRAEQEAEEQEAARIAQARRAEQEAARIAQREAARREEAERARRLKHKRERQEQQLKAHIIATFETSFQVLKKNHSNKTGKIHHFHFGPFNNDTVNIQAKQALTKMMSCVSPKTLTGPVISYNNGEKVIFVSGLEKVQDVPFPKGSQRDEWHEFCYKVSGRFYEYGRKGWSEKTNRHLLYFWVSKTSSINDHFLDTYYGELQK